ncbi:hypothetical protein SALBM311S_09025 [Streptomyces alboniger]
MAGQVPQAEVGLSATNPIALRGGVRGTRCEAVVRPPLCRSGYRAAASAARGSGRAAQQAAEVVVLAEEGVEAAAHGDPACAPRRRRSGPAGTSSIQVPDPQSRYARLLGRWWLPWLQPQHLHFVPVANLRERLADLGFTVVAEQHAEPHDPVDLLAAVWLALDHMAPRDDAPWLPEPPNALRRTLRGALLVAGIPRADRGHAPRPVRGPARCRTGWACPTPTGSSPAATDGCACGGRHRRPSPRPRSRCAHPRPGRRRVRPSTSSTWTGADHGYDTEDGEKARRVYAPTARHVRAATHAVYGSGRAAGQLSLTPLEPQ